MGRSLIPQPIERVLRELSRVTGDIFTLEKWAEIGSENVPSPPLDFAILNFVTRMPRKCLRCIFLPTA